MDGEKKKFNWAEFLVIVVLVGLTAVVTWGVTWYIMDQNMQDLQNQYNTDVAHYKSLIATYEEQLKTATTVAEPVTSTMVQNGTYTLGGVKVSLVNGTATVSGNTYTVDTAKVAYNADKTKAAVVVKETAGTTAVNTYLTVVENKNGAVSQVATATVTGTVTTVSYGTDGKITVTTTTTGSTTPTNTVYTVSGGKLVAQQ